MPRVAAKDREAFIESRRSEIVEAAVRLWAERGFEGSSMSALAREVGLTKGTLYLYFPSKIALLDEVLRRYSLRPDIESLIAAFRDQPLDSVVRTLVSAAWGRLRERQDAILMLLRELPGQLHKAEHFITEVMVPTNRALADLLEEKLPPERRMRINTIVAARSLISMVVMFFVTQELLGGQKFLPVAEEDATATISELFLNGVLGGGDA